MTPEFWVIKANDQAELAAALDNLKRNTLAQYSRIEQLSTSITHGTSGSTHNLEVSDKTTFTYDGHLYVIVSAMVEK